MSRLTDTARAAVQRSQRTANLPDWWIAAGGVLLVLVVLALALQVISGSSGEVTAEQNRPDLTEPITAPTSNSAVPSTPQTEPTPQADPTVAPEPSTAPAVPEGPAFTVTEANGRGTIAVPASANEFARSALRALYSGNTKVPTAPGSKPVAALGNFASPQLSDVTAAIDHGTSLQLFFTLDPDGPGSTASRTVSLHVVPQGDSYAVLVE